MRIVLAALALGLLLAGGAWSAARDLDTPRTLHSTPYAGAQACKRCHTEHYASWHRTFHRTMTQEASGQAVLGTWDGTTLDYMGVRARMHRDRDGQPMISFVSAAGTERWQARVERTVGSHRYQQYLARSGSEWWRLPIAWDARAQRFIHMNGAFLTPDPEISGPNAPVARVDYERHVTRWNDNCIFCHNVRPNPGFDRDKETFDSEVEQLGIACEACHGPGDEHIARNQNPVRRYLLHATGKPDPTIRNPARMTSERSAQVCGRCHGQRITGHIERYLARGDTFIPGDDLAAHSTPLSRDTPLGGKAGAFAPRFWSDGTPRLTAYEYQGYLQSACRADDKFTCESCHAMHAGDPRSQLRPDVTGDRMCTQCHQALAGAEAAAQHARHDAAGSGARCVSCHMPKIVYGLVSMHVSHRIEIPRPAEAATHSRPDACTLCHVDRTRAWAVQQSARLYETALTSVPESPLSETETRLLAGDPIERAAAASALGDPQSAFSATLRSLALLLDTMLEDNYPAVRDIAGRSAHALLHRTAVSPERSASLPVFAATDTREQRTRAVHAWRQSQPDLAQASPPSELIAPLRAQSEQTRIEIGE